MASPGHAINRTALIQALIAMGLLLPGLLLFPLGINAAMCVFVYGVMIGFLLAMLTNLRLTLAVVAAFTVANVIGLTVAPYPWVAALVMAVAVLLYGLTLRIGIATLIVVAPTSVAFTITQPPALVQHGSVFANALVLAAVCIIAGIWGAAAGTVIGRRVPSMPHTRVSWRSTWVFTGALTVVCGIVAVIVELAHLPQEGAWILLTILIVCQPSVHRTWRKVGDRLIGTFIGFAVALVVALPLPGHPMALTVAAIVLFGIAAYFMLAKRPYWQFVMFLTPGVVLVVGATTSVLSTDISRVWSTIVGAGIAVVMLLVLGAVGVHDHDESSRGDRA